MTLFVGMFDHTCYILWVDGVQNVEEVISSREQSLSQAVREVHHELFVLLHDRPQLKYRNLVICRDIDIADVAERHQFLLVGQN